jgi:DNA repair protein RecO (recombination protein O)
MAREVQVEGVVLRRWYAGEYDKWVSLLTPDCGKLRLRVRGGRKPKSKMGMLTEPLSRIKARVIEGREQRLLVQPQLVRSYVNVRLDLERLTIALALGETLDRWLPAEHPEPEVYAVLVDALGSLEGEALPAGVAAQGHLAVAGGAGLRARFEPVRPLWGCGRRWVRDCERATVVCALRPARQRRTAQQ